MSERERERERKEEPFPDSLSETSALSTLFAGLFVLELFFLFRPLLIPEESITTHLPLLQ